jgi:NAD(P)-dependent dehydrogenase (short-subunit alcohol dehydrogenase family)|tara:strand:- start:37 stop:801 length:765 start_codon:yes stop_codon:yes gene_type:complete
MFNLDNKVAVITGSSKGIGKSIATAMALQGAKVSISSRKVDVCEQTAAEINELCKDGIGEAFVIPCNISDKSSLENLVEKTKEKYGQIDILVCNAASNPFFGSLKDIPDEAFEKIMNNNIKANHNLSQMVIPEMIERKDGSIIVVSSIGGLRASEVIGAYNISKAADIMLVKNLAAEFGKFNIRTNAIAPGLFRTDFAKALWENPEILKASTATCPMKRIGEPDEIGGAAVFLASQAGSFVNGHTLVIDGGSIA